MVKIISWPQCLHTLPHHFLYTHEILNIYIQTFLRWPLVHSCMVMGPAQGQKARQSGEWPWPTADKYIPRAVAPNNTPSLIPTAPSQLYKLLTAHPVNPVAERAVKLPPPSKQHSKVPLLYDMMEAKNSHFPLRAFQMESYPLWWRLPALP